MAENTPLYNLKAVIKEVGINPVTLRAWERRYDLIKPRRSPGGHRLYSRQDIEMLKWLIERQDEGLSISSAIEMWKSQHQDDLTVVEHIPTPVPVNGTGESILDAIRERWLSACLSYDDVSANRVLDEAFAAASPEMIIGEVLQKGLAWIGEHWYTGTVSVQQEHFTSAIAIRRIQSLLMAAASPTRPGQILAACPPDEEHTFTLMVVTYLLRRRGWDVVYLGSNVPLNQLDKTIQATSPVLVLSAAQTLTTAASLRTLSEYLNDLGIPMAYGGGIFSQISELSRLVSGYYLGTDIGRVAGQVERIITEPSAMPIAAQLSKPYSQALSKFLENGAEIIAQVSSAFPGEVIDPAPLESANLFFSRFITSALTLGDISLLDHTLEQIDHTLQSSGLTAALIDRYYNAYHQAVEHYLGEDGIIILDWLAKHEFVV